MSESGECRTGKIPRDAKSRVPVCYNASWAGTANSPGMPQFLPGRIPWPSPGLSPGPSPGLSPWAGLAKSPGVPQSHPGPAPTSQAAPSAQHLPIYPGTPLWSPGTATPGKQPLRACRVLLACQIAPESIAIWNRELSLTGLLSEWLLSTQAFNQCLPTAGLGDQSRLKAGR
jgi:hypothetical protein